MKRKHKSSKARQDAKRKYRALVTEILSGEVGQLYWTDRKQRVEVKVMGDHIYLTEQSIIHGTGNVTRIITAGDIARGRFTKVASEEHWSA